MALRLSDALRNHLLQHGSLKNALENGQIEIYTGTQPANANAAPTGTKLVVVTKASAARTAEVLATGTVTLNSGSSGSVDSITVNSIQLLEAAVAFNTSLTQTAADVATSINQGISSPEYTATSSGAVITIKALPGTGAGANGFVVASTCTTITKTDVNLASGVAAANGLRLASASGGSITKRSADTWSGVGITDGTAGWFRFKGSVVDGDSLDSTATFIRLDGSVSTSGADLNLTNTSIATSAVETITAATFTQPAS